MSDSRNPAEPGLSPREGESTLEFTQRVRREMIEDMTKGGLPDDNKERVTLLHALSDMDGQELNKQKIDAKSASNDNERMALDILNGLMTGQARNINPFLKQAAADGPAVTRPALPNLDVVDFQPLPGETDVGLASQDLPAFARRSGMRMDTIPGMSGAKNEEYDDKVQEDPEAV